MSIYDDLRDAAGELFTEFKQGTVQYVPIETTPGATPDRPGSTAKGTAITLTATAKPVSTKYVDGSRVIESDIEVTIPNDGKATPTMAGYIRIDGSDHKIISIMPKPAAGDPIVWAVIVRR